MDCIARLLASTPDFKGKWRLQALWCRMHAPGAVRERVFADGLRFHCELRIPYESGIWLGIEEKSDLVTLRSLLCEGQVFVDCGANIGLWTVHAAAGVGSTGFVYAIEPHAATFRKLLANIAANQFQERVEARQVAVDSRPGKVRLSSQIAHNLNRIVEAGAADAPAIEVQATTLDDLLRDSPQVHGLKIDVEGHEQQALVGAREVLRRWYPWVCVEFNPEFCTSAALHEWPPHRYLRELGYSASFMSDPGVPVAESFVAKRYLNILYRHAASGKG